MKKVKITSAVIIITAISFLIFSNFTVPKATTDNSGTLIWKVSSDKLSEPSYLYGTIHLLPKDEFFLGNDALQCLQTASSLTLEVDMDVPIKDQIKMVQRMMLPKGKTIADYMNETDYANLHSYLVDSLNIKKNSIEKYFKLKPFNLLGLVCMEYYGDLEMYEQVFSKIAKKNKIRINALESIDEQFSIIENSGMDMQTPTGEDIYIIDMFEELKAVYLQKNMDKITEYVQDGLAEEDDDNLEAKLLVDRNLNWIPKLDSIMQKESSFIAVGAAHLGGETGIIELLCQKGYSVEAIN